MKNNDASAKPRPFMDLMEESLHLLRTAPLAITLLFYLGSIPFVLGLLLFIMDFTTSAYTARQTAAATAGLVLLYAWMKTWQAVFCRQLRAWLCGNLEQSRTLSRLPSVFLQQLILQPTSFLVIPVSLIITFPFGWAYAFYQSVSVLGDGSEPSLKKLCARAWHQASLWPKQNHLGIWLISPILFLIATVPILSSLYFVTSSNPDWADSSIYGIYTAAFLLLVFTLIVNPGGTIVTVNAGVALYLLPHLLKMLTGFESIFTVSTSYLLSTTFIVAVCSLTYLALEPLMKSFYVLRCFYGDSIRTAEDLKAGFQLFSARRLAQTAAVAAFLFLPLLPAAAQNSPSPEPAPVSAGQFDESANRVLESHKYAWRIPDAEGKKEKDQGLFGYFLEAVMERFQDTADSIGELIANFLQYLEKLFDRKPVAVETPKLNPAGGSWPVATQIVLWVLITVLAVTLALFLLKIRRHLPARSFVRATPKPAAPEPDLDSEEVTAADLPTDEWESLASRLMQEGNLRLALRALFLSTLSLLGRKELLLLRRSKTNREYERELRRRAFSHPELLSRFSQNLSIFERSWYGAYETSPEIFQSFQANQQAIRNSLET